jgi:hypothetical protein
VGTGWETRNQYLCIKKIVKNVLGLGCKNKERKKEISMTEISWEQQAMSKAAEAVGRPAGAIKE